MKVSPPPCCLPELLKGPSELSLNSPRRKKSHMALFQSWKSALDDVTKGTSASLVDSTSSFKNVMNLYDTLSAIMKILFYKSIVNAL